MAFWGSSKTQHSRHLFSHLWTILKKMKTDSAVQSSLFSYGKTSCVPTRIRATPRGFLQTTTKIGVQPTAVSRRKAALGGRRALGAGRPPKSSRKDHPYTKCRRAKAVPHSLSHCVQENTSLGKTHQVHTRTLPKVQNSSLNQLLINSTSISLFCFRSISSWFYF